MTAEDAAPASVPGTGAVSSSVTTVLGVRRGGKVHALVGSTDRTHCGRRGAWRLATGRAFERGDWCGRCLRATEGT